MNFSEAGDIAVDGVVVGWIGEDHMRAPAPHQVGVARSVPAVAAIHAVIVQDPQVSATIEGSVVDEKGMPVAGAAVVTLPSSGKVGRPDAYQSGVSDEQGHFLLRGLNPGGFLLLAFEEMLENVRSPEFAEKYRGKGEQVELEEGGKKRVVLKVVNEDLEP